MNSSHGSFPAKSHRHRWLVWKSSASQPASFHPIFHPKAKRVKSINHKKFYFGSRSMASLITPASSRSSCSSRREMTSSWDRSDRSAWSRAERQFSSRPTMSFAIAWRCSCISPGCTCNSSSSNTSLVRYVHSINFNLKVTNLWFLQWNRKHLFRSEWLVQEREISLESHSVRERGWQNFSHTWSRSNTTIFMRSVKKISYFNREKLLLSRTRKAVSSQSGWNASLCQ